GLRAGLGLLGLVHHIGVQDRLTPGVEVPHHRQRRPHQVGDVDVVAVDLIDVEVRRETVQRPAQRAPRRHLVVGHRVHVVQVRSRLRLLAGIVGATTGVLRAPAGSQGKGAGHDGHDPYLAEQPHTSSSGMSKTKSVSVMQVNLYSSLLPPILSRFLVLATHRSASRLEPLPNRYASVRKPNPPVGASAAPELLLTRTSGVTGSDDLADCSKVAGGAMSCTYAMQLRVLGLALGPFVGGQLIGEDEASRRESAAARDVRWARQIAGQQNPLAGALLLRIGQRNG